MANWTWAPSARPSTRATPGKRKVVLATNIAETSLTIDGVRVVVDAGLARVPRFDPNSGMTRLDTQRISRASATQRAGRAGRLEPGVCYRLWSEAQHEQLAAYGSPEILQADLAGLALQLARWGVTPDQLTWLDSPPTAAYFTACDLLLRLGAMAEQSHNLTGHGQAMAQLPAHPRIAHLLLRGQALGLTDLACDVAAMLGERDIVRGAGADLHSRLAMLSGEQRAARGAQGAVQRIKQLACNTAAIYPKLLQPKRSATLTTRAGWAPCWRWRIRIGSPISAEQAARNIAWPTVVPPCLARPMP